MENQYKKLQTPQGLFVYADFPKIEHIRKIFEAGSIYLQQGNENWGAKHIIRFHSREFSGQSVEEFVQDIVRSETPVHCEFEGMDEQQKILVVNSRRGTAVLRWVAQQGGGFYTVVTAFARKHSIGERIGKLL